jgi:hypothetical protein
MTEPNYVSIWLSGNDPAKKVAPSMKNNASKQHSMC